MSDTTHIRIYESDKERVEELRGDLNNPALLNNALNALERERGQNQDTE